MGSVSASEKEFQSHLNHARAYVRLNLSESCRFNIADGKTKIGVVEQVEQFTAELKFFGFAEVNVFERREVPVDIARTDHCVAALITEHLNLSLRVRL